MPATPARLILAACGLALIAGPLHADGPAVHYRVMALTGTDGNLGPQLGTNVVFKEFTDPPSINSGGLVALLGRLEGPGVGSSNDLAMFFTSGSALQMVVRTGATYTSFGHPGSVQWAPPLSDAGEVVLRTFGTDSCGNTHHLRVFSGSGTRTIAQSRRLGTGISGVSFPGFHPQALVNAAGDVLIGAGMNPASRDPGSCSTTTHHQWPNSNYSGMWMFDAAGNVLPIAVTRTDLPSLPDHLGPGLGPDIYFGSTFWSEYMAFNDHQEFAFFQDLSGVPSATRSVWYRGSAATGKMLLARTGFDDLLGPGLGPGTTFSTHAPGRVMRLNNRGRVVFQAHVSGEYSGPGLFVADRGEPVKPIAVSTPVADPLYETLGPPPLASNLRWSTGTSNFFAHFCIDGNDRIAFWSQAHTPAPNIFRGIFLHDGGTNHAIALQDRDGSYGPGLGAGITFSHINFGTLQCGAEAGVIFAATLSGVPTNQRKTLWLYHYEHGLTLLAQSGTPFELSPGDVRHIVSIDTVSGPPASSENGLPRSMNDTGEIAMRLEFAGGSEAIVVATVEYPDPSCYADCDGNGTLNIADFLCFIDAFASGDPYADCDESGTLNIADFLCFIDEFAQGCP